MKGRSPCLTLFGSNSGNNVGDAAILSAILAEVTAHLPDAEFLVPTTNPEFINSKYGSQYRVRALNIMPWNLSFRFLGLPSLRCLWKSDAALICDGIIFGKNFWNPTFNLLITLAPLAFFAKLFGCRMVCYSVGIGPFPKGQGSRFARYLIQSCDLIMMREAESKRLAETLGVTKPVLLTGDAAFINPVSSPARAAEIATRLKIPADRLLGVNMTQYVNSWMNEGGERSDPGALVETLASGISQAREAVGGAFTPVIFSTHPMDEELCRTLATRLGAPLVSNTEFLSHDIQAVMQMCSLFVGMRFHSLVLASAVGAPVVGIVYAPKVRGLMQDLHCPEYALEMNKLSSTGLAEVITRAWNSRDHLLRTQQPVVESFKQGAQRAAQLLAQLVRSGSAGSDHAKESLTVNG